MDLLTPHSIAQHLGTTARPWKLQVVEETDSTNTRLEQAAKAGAADDILLVADHQTAGRGRLGRSFLSPAGSGVYMSLLLHPALPMARCTDLTVAAAVCVARALEKLCGLQADIKWVNDLYVGGKKLCGILTEGALGQNGMADFVVVGIGLNVGRPDCGDDTELAAIVTSLEEELGHTVDRSQLIAAILWEFDRYYADMEQNHPAMLEEYRRRMFLVGKEVTLSTDPAKRPHLVLGVDENARLLVRTPDGSTLSLQSGEVSIRTVCPRKGAPMQTKELTRIALFTALMALLSQIIIPLPGGVPISLSTLGVMLCGGLLPPRRAFTTQLCYLLLGLVGAPVFSSFGGGPGWLLGPTGGYLLSYPLMALVIALLMARFPSLPRWLAFLPGLFVCYLLGTGWLAFSTRCGFGHALAVGVFPFLLPDFLKVMLATVLVKGLAPLTKQ